MPASPFVICLGSSVLDRVFEVPAFPPKPIKVTATRYRESCGGIAATAAVAIAALGGRAAYWGRMGEDESARVLMAAFREHGVDVTGTRRIPGAQTPTAAVIVNAQGERLLFVHPGSGLDPDPSWLALERLAEASAVLADFRWVKGATTLLEAARSRDLPRVVDADLGGLAAFDRLLPLADHVIFAQPALAEMTRTEDPAEGLRRAAVNAGGLVGVTLGPAGAMWLENGRVHRQAAFPVVARDTTGAGDTFHGAYALAIAEGRPVAAAMELAAAAAAIKCARGEGWAGMPDRAAAEALLKGRTA